MFVRNRSISEWLNVSSNI